MIIALVTVTVVGFLLLCVMAVAIENLKADVRRLQGWKEGAESVITKIEQKATENRARILNLEKELRGHFEREYRAARFLLGKEE